MRQIVNYLDNINTPSDVKTLNIKQLRSLAGEIRTFLIESVSKTGGHLATNLGVVELSIALHYVFQTPKDKIVWDVGHQSYTHKILTGRKDVLQEIKNNGGISGFPRTDESVHDAFNTGHSSTSISVALGLAKAAELIGDDETCTIAVIGDGAMTGGMAFEALNNAGIEGTNLIVVLNDNQMSICKNVGAFSRYLNRFRTMPVYNSFKELVDFLLKRIPKIGEGMASMAVRTKNAVRSLVFPTTIFEELGFKYSGPVDGHNIDELIIALKRAKKLKGPVLLHVITKKGKGYQYAEKQPEDFHTVGDFNIITGAQNNLIKIDKAGADSAFGEKMCELAKVNKRLIAINAAMTKGTGLRVFRSHFPKRFFDVGIAEGHAVTFAAGMAAAGMRPVVAIYSSFMQRAYDQILHDVCLQNLPVILMLPSAGLNKCGETHHGIFDLSFLSSMPNLNIVAPSSINQLTQALEYAVFHAEGPIAIRYPQKLEISGGDFTFGKARVVAKGADVSLFCIGDMLEVGKEAARLSGVSCEIIDVGTVRPLDVNTLLYSIHKTGAAITLESNCVQNGAGMSIKNALQHTGIYCMGFERDNIPQWATLADCGLDAKAVAIKIIEINKKLREVYHA
ncbi:MAG: 1-deoxy-D-xylulose-5-phosphate synthase [Clostridiales bacterium]|nr:1-deoxy-D-xylulose-5-phosphate synthase [Clostridiales bacterium]